jgi:hypothetical protein
MFKRPNTVGLVAGAAVALVALGSGVAMASSATAARPAQVIHQTAAAGSEASSEASTSESASSRSDGLGGHADPAGNVDHQFNGNE